jgi:ankyrin repeat protein
LAAACGHLSCLATLLSNTSDDVSELQDSQGCTVLHWACYNGKDMASKVLPLEPYKRNKLTVTEFGFV